MLLKLQLGLGMLFFPSRYTGLWSLKRRSVLQREIVSYYQYRIFTCSFLLSSSLSLRDFSRNDSNSTSFSCKNELLLSTEIDKL